MLKFYERELWKSINYDFKNKKCNLKRIVEFVATTNINYWNYKKKNKFKESQRAYDFFMNHDYLEKDRIYSVNLFKNY